MPTLTECKSKPSGTRVFGLAYAQRAVFVNVHADGHLWCCSCPVRRAEACVHTTIVAAHLEVLRKSQ